VACRFNVRLRDSMNNLVRTVVYHVPYRSVGGETHHLIGVREDAEAWCPTEPRGEAVLRPDIASEVSVAQPAPPPTPSSGSSSRRRNVVSSSHGGSRASDLASSRLRANPYGEWQEPEKDMALRIAVEPGLPVWSMGDSLRTQLGIVGRDPVDLVEFLPGEGAEFSRWLQKVADDPANCHRRQSFTLRFGELALTSEREGAATPVRGTAFVYFERPRPVGGGKKEYVNVGLSRGLRLSTPLGRGTAASSTPQPLTLGAPPARRSCL